MMTLMVFYVSGHFDGRDCHLCPSQAKTTGMLFHSYTLNTLLSVTRREKNNNDSPPLSPLFRNRDSQTFFLPLFEKREKNEFDYPSL